MDLEQAIRERAYFMWLDGRCVHGNADAHWLAAETEILAASMETVARVMSRSEDARDERAVAKSKTKRRTADKRSSVSGGRIRSSSAPRKNDKRSPLVAATSLAQKPYH
jgi:hypothetical protein